MDKETAIHVAISALEHQLVNAGTIDKGRVILEAREILREELTTLATLKEHLAECTEQRDVAWKRIDQLTSELAAVKSSVSQWEPIIGERIGSANIDALPHKIDVEPNEGELVIRPYVGDHFMFFLPKDIRLCRLVSQRPPAATHEEMVLNEIADAEDAAESEYEKMRRLLEDGEIAAEPTPVDHLVEAKEWIAETVHMEPMGIEHYVALAQAHALISIADSLSKMLATYPNGETYVNVRVQGTVER